MIRTLRALLAIATLAALLVAGALVDVAGADAGTEADFVARVNGARSAKGLATLTTDGELTAIARRWSQRMADDNRLSHNPNLANEVTQNWEKLAENVGVGPTVEEIHNAFMNSAPHRANILDSALTHIGVGVVTDGSGQIWVTQVFMRLRGGGGGGGTASPTTAAPAPAPTAAPTTTTTRPRPTTTTTTVAAGAVPPPAPVATAPRAIPATTTTTEPPTTTTAPPPPPEPAASASPSASGTPSPRLVLVLDGLRALDRGQ